MNRFFALLRSACYFIFGLAWMSCGPILHANLSWNQKTVELYADSQTPVLSAQFKFVNKGSAAVDITKLESSCGCTVATLAQRHYEPGQFGEITVAFTVGNHTGLQKKTILVSASDLSFSTTLMLIVHIPELVHIQPAAITWKHNEQSNAKIIGVEILQETPVSDIQVLSSNRDVVVFLHPVQPGRKYEISVAPLKTDQTIFSTITIYCFFGNVEKITHSYASVQSPVPDQ